MLAGTAVAARRSGERAVEREYAESEQDQRLSQLESQGGPAPPAPSGGSDLVAELTKLKGLADAGALTPQEFEAAKAKLLAS
jgi:hypothetical protein